MNLLQESIFLSEIAFHSDLAQRGAEHLFAINENVDKIEVWSSVQSILIAAGNISKILWPNKKYKERGKKLRELLNVDSNSVLRSRKFRNLLEHYDELIDDLFANHPTASYIDFAMNPSMSFSGRKCHRGYNSFNNTLVIRGQILDLNVLLKAIKDIKLKCSPYVPTR